MGHSLNCSMCASQHVRDTIFSLIQTLVLTLEVLQRVCFTGDRLLTIEGFILVFFLWASFLEKDPIFVWRNALSGFWALWVVTYCGFPQLKFVKRKTLKAYLTAVSPWSWHCSQSLRNCSPWGEDDIHAVGSFGLWSFLQEDTVEGTLCPHVFSFHLLAG